MCFVKILQQISKLLDLDIKREITLNISVVFVVLKNEIINL